MPINCTIVSVDEVQDFFANAIDGMGKQDGYPRNEGVPGSIARWKTAKLCELTENEFQHLIVPQEPKILLKDKPLQEVEGEDSIGTMNRYYQMLVEGEKLPAIIVRLPLHGDLEQGSYYIEDGAHKALGCKKYFEVNPYIPVLAYIGELG